MPLFQNREYQLDVDSNENVVAELLLTLHGDNIEDSEKQDIATNINFETIVPSIK